MDLQHPLPPSIPPAVGAEAPYNSDDPFQARLKELSTQLKTDATDFATAYQARNDTRLRELQAEGRKNFDEILNTCQAHGWTITPTAKQLRSYFDKTPENALTQPGTPVPTPDAPDDQAPTPRGTRVMIGDTVRFETTTNGKKSTIALRITSVDKATATQLKSLDPKALANVQQIVFVQATATGNNDALNSLDPTFAVATAENVPHGPLQVSGAFPPCQSEPAKNSTRHLCAPFGIASATTGIKAAALTGITTGQADKKNPLYIWQLN